MSLKITPQISILDSVELNEYVDIKLLNKLIVSKLIQEPNDKWDEKKQLKSYCKLYKNNKITVKYERTKKYGLGRVYPNKNLGLSQIRREIRHTLCKDNFVDIDIVNCHPVLLEQLCIKNNIRCDNLSKYINSRELIFSQFNDLYSIDKDTVKKLFINIINGGEYSKWCYQNNFKDDKSDLCDYIKNYENEMQIIINKFVNENSELQQKIKKDNSKAFIK